MPVGVGSRGTLSWSEVGERVFARTPSAPRRGPWRAIQRLSRGACASARQALTSASGAHLSECPARGVAEPSAQLVALNADSLAGGELESDPPSAAVLMRLIRVFAKC